MFLYELSNSIDFQLILMNSLNRSHNILSSVRSCATARNQVIKQTLRYYASCYVYFS